MSPLVSIVMATYNGEKFLAKTLDSIIGQTYTNFELIIIDDLSSDSTSEIIQEYAIQDSRIKYFQREENSQNPAIPRREAVAKIQGALLCNCDQDDIWYPEKLELQVKVALNYKDEKIIVTGRNHILLDGVHKIEGEPLNTSSEYLTKVFQLGDVPVYEVSMYVILLRNIVMNSNVMFVSSVFKDIGGLKTDPQFRGVEDFDYLIRAMSRGYRLLLIDKTTAGWTRHQDNVTLQTKGRSGSRSLLNITRRQLREGSWTMDQKFWLWNRSLKLRYFATKHTFEHQPTLKNRLILGWTLSIHLLFKVASRFKKFPLDE